MQIPLSKYLPFVSAAGAKLEGGSAGSALVNGTTYYVGFGGEEAPFLDIHFQWDAVIIITSVEVELSCNPDAALNSVVLGEWVKTNLVSASAALEASSGTVTALTLSAIAGGTMGGAIWHLITGSKRGRLKVVVAGTGGSCKAMGHGKA